MNIGYARVSTLDQNLDLQTDDLRRAGCERIFTDKASGALASREGLGLALDFVREGDTLVVWKLDRLGRSVPHLITTINDLKVRGVEFRSLNEHFDTTGAAGQLMFNIFASFAQFERDLIRERTVAGIAAARARGRCGGRKPKLDAAGIEAGLELLKTRPLKDVAHILHVSESTVRRRVMHGVVR